MKSISAAIVLLSGAIIFAAGALITHSDTQLFVMGVGLCIGVLGLGSWYKAFNEPHE